MMVKWWLMILDNLQGTNADPIFNSNAFHAFDASNPGDSSLFSPPGQGAGGAGSQLVGLTAATRLGAGGWRWGIPISHIFIYRSTVS